MNRFLIETDEDYEHWVYTESSDWFRNWQADHPNHTLALFTFFDDDPALDIWESIVTQDGFEIIYSERFADGIMAWVQRKKVNPKKAIKTLVGKYNGR